MDTVVAEWLRRLDSQTLPCIQNVTDVCQHTNWHICVRVRVSLGICEIVIQSGHQNLQYKWGVILKAFPHDLQLFPGSERLANDDSTGL